MMYAPSVETHAALDLRDVPSFASRTGNYTVRFARTSAEVDAALRLRFDVFNLELGEGLDESYLTGRDQDVFDAVCHHLLVIDEPTAQVVGTYRMQTGAMAAAGHGFYANGEFDLDALPAALRANAVELGRACIARAHRTPKVLFLLWRGVAAYMQHQRQRYLFGCCSLTSQDPRAGWHVLHLLEQQGALHHALAVTPRPRYACPPVDLRVGAPPSVAIPRLFKAYLRYGTKVCGPPALDRRFKTIDFFVMLDFAAMDSQARAFFLGA